MLQPDTSAGGNCAHPPVHKSRLDGLVDLLCSILCSPDELLQQHGARQSGCGALLGWLWENIVINVPIAGAVLENQGRDRCMRNWVSRKHA